MVKLELFGEIRDIDFGDPNVTVDEILEYEKPLADCHHGTLLSTYEDAKLHYRYFLPPNNNNSNNKPPTAIVLNVHGVQGQSGNGFVVDEGRRKLNVALLADRYTQQGMALYALDQYGHGLSEGDRFFIPSYENNLQDYLNLIRHVLDQYDQSHPDTPIPVFLTGESYGGGLTILAARRYQDHPALWPHRHPLAGIFVSAPAIQARVPPTPVVMALQYVLAPTVPKWRPTLLMPNVTKPEDIWGDAEIRKLRTHPRRAELKIDGCGGSFRLGTASELIDAVREVHDYAIPGFALPFYVVHGTDDPSTLHAGSEYFYQTAATPAHQKRFRSVPGGKHDTFAGPDAESVVDSAVEWMRERMQQMQQEQQGPKG